MKYSISWTFELFEKYQSSKVRAGMHQSLPRVNGNTLKISARLRVNSEPCPVHPAWTQTLPAFETSNPRPSTTAFEQQRSDSIKILVPKIECKGARLWVNFCALPLLLELTPRQHPPNPPDRPPINDNVGHACHIYLSAKRSRNFFRILCVKLDKKYSFIRIIHLLYFLWTCIDKWPKLQS